MHFAVRRSLFGLVAAAAAVCVAWQAPPARASGDNTAELAQGGRATGDISSTPGETDVVGFDLVAGQSLRATWFSTFDAELVVRGPSGAEISFFEGTGRRRSIPKGFVVTTTGGYQVEIRSPSAAEGRYVLTVTPSWARVLRFSGTGPTTLQLGMPATSSVQGRVVAGGASSQPEITAVRRPDASDLLPAPIVGSGRVAVLPSTACDTVGTYALDVTAAGGDGRWSASFKRTVTAVPLLRVDARNGVNGIGFEAGGVRDLLVSRCAGCHGWAATYGGARGYARKSLSKMRSGDMPKVGPRISAEGIDLFRRWIEAGYPR